MKKSLIALAVLGTCGAAMAQSSVTLYGMADVWVGRTKAEATVGGVSASASESVLESGGFNTSRLGFKGSEDLGGGLKANFNLEGALAMDNGTAGGLRFDRQSWVGLSGGFGEIQLGKPWTPYDDTRAMANDTFNANFAASWTTWLFYEDNPNNTIRYNTPNFGGFSGAIAYSLGEDRASSPNNSASNLVSLSVNYANGPIVAGFAHQSQKVEGLNGLDSTGILTGLAATGKTTYNLLNGSYDFGMLKLVGGVNQVKVQPDGVADVKANEWNLGVDVPVGAGFDIGVGVARSKVESSGVDLTTTTGFSIGAKYTLSKRTFLYAAFNRTKTEFETLPGDEVKGTLFGLGIQHNF
ncbi:porin [uncultured Hydrogenophaga sp.]|jgi:predicted porin|uniref:porin n=1 Tax=uncultured Hydrogenophaga sp. TaxID=199683 RepID=UPI0025903C53|nr:porin [uncultured Hydrogenophaga sp.]